MLTSWLQLQPICRYANEWQLVIHLDYIPSRQKKTQENEEMETHFEHYAFTLVLCCVIGRLVGRLMLFHVNDQRFPPTPAGKSSVGFRVKPVEIFGETFLYSGF